MKNEKINKEWKTWIEDKLQNDEEVSYLKLKNIINDANIKFIGRNNKIGNKVFNKRIKHLTKEINLIIKQFKIKDQNKRLLK